MPKGREEKFRYNRDGSGAVTAIRKGSEYDKIRKSMKEDAKKSIESKGGYGLKDKSKDRVAESVANTLTGLEATRKAIRSKRRSDAPFFKHTQKDN